MEAEQFGAYTLVRCLAIGGMGQLYLAQRDGVAGFSKQLVVKRIRPELAGDPEFVEMFLNEGRLAAMLDHPNVVHIHELGEVDGAFFMAMEYVAGKNLGTTLSRNGGPLELSVALGVLNGICEGMAFAHDAIGHDGLPRNLVHRDINPQNVLISYSGTVKIADFGIAKAQIQRKETQVGVLKGKFGYLSPEQARSGEIDRRSDIYTLGLLLFEATIGQPAIPGKSDTQLLFAAAEGIVQRPTDFTPSYPARLEEIYLKATAKAPADRYQNVKDLQEDLLAFQLDQRLVITSSKLAELMRELFGAESTGERRLPTPARAASAVGSSGRSAVQRPKPSSRQIRPSSPGLDPDEPGLHQAPTLMESSSVTAGVGSQPRAHASADDISGDRPQMSRSSEAPDGPPGLTSAETQMLERSQPAAAGAAPGLASAETRMLDRSPHEVVVPAPAAEDPDDLRRTDPRPRAAIPFQPPVPVEPTDRPRSRWPVIVISLLVTLLLGGAAAYVFLLRPDLVEGLGLAPSGAGVDGAAPSRSKDAGRLAAGDPLDGATTTGDRSPTAAAPGDASASVSVSASADARATAVAAGHHGDRRRDAGAADPDTAGVSGTSVRAPPDAGVRKVEPRKNRVEIGCKPRVTIFWHGSRLGQTPLTAELPVGRQRLVLRSRELEINVRRLVTVPRPGVTARVDLVVERGTLVIKARPWAHVTVNGTRRGTTPIKPLKLYEGSHRLKLTNTAHGSHEARVTIRPGETTRLVHVFK